MSTVQTLDVKNVAIALLVPSSTEAQKQRRAHFDKDSLKQLAENIASVGLVNPILVRPLGDKLEIVAGERRFQAAKLAKLDQVPVSVRELDDGQVLELQLIENLQREGLHELHEAEGYEALKKRGLSAIEIASKVNKSKEYVFGRMKLLALSKSVREAFYDNEINAAVALLIARIPNEKLQKEALADVTKGLHGNGPMTFRQAKDHLQAKFTLRLDQAPFDTADATLLKNTPACGGCTKNTLAQPELFGDVKATSAGVCTDTICFQAKCSAAIDGKVKAAKAEGRVVIEGKEAKAIFPHGTHYAHNGYYLPESTVWHNSTSRAAKALLKKDKQPRLVRIESDGREQLVEVVHSTDLDLPKPKSSSTRSAGGRGISAPKEDPKTKLELGLRTSVLADLHAAAAKPLHRDELEMIADRVGDTAYAYGVISKILGSNVVNLKKLTEQQLLKYIRVQLHSDACEDISDKPDLLFASAKRAGVNVESIRKELTAEHAEKDKKAAAPAKPKAKAKGKPKAKKSAAKKK